jgi:competence protein ComEA
MKYIKKYWYYSLILIIVLSSVLFVNLPNPKIEDPIETGDPVIHEFTSYIYVDIKGQVEHPGVYKVLENTRLFQVVELAGGLTTEANDLLVNLSMILYDQDVVIIPSIYDEVEEIVEEPTSTLIDINRASQSELETLPGIGPATAEAIINYRDNVSSFDRIEDIMNVPGIGESTYEAIKDLITI